MFSITIPVQWATGHPTDDPCVSMEIGSGVDHQGEWLGPEWRENTKWKRGDEVLDAMRYNPAEMENLRGGPQSISRLANEIVCDHLGSWHTGEEHTQRKTVLWLQFFNQEFRF